MKNIEEWKEAQRVIKLFKAKYDKDITPYIRSIRELSRNAKISIEAGAEIIYDALNAPLEMNMMYGGSMKEKFEKLSNHKAKKQTTPNPRPLFGKDPNEVFNFKRKRG